MCRVLTQDEILVHHFNPEVVIDVVEAYLEDQEECFYFEGISKLEQDGDSASRQSEIILRNNGTMSALGHSQSTGTKNFFIVPRTSPVCQMVVQ